MTKEFNMYKLISIALMLVCIVLLAQYIKIEYQSTKNFQFDNLTLSEQEYEGIMEVLGGSEIIRICHIESNECTILQKIEQNAQTPKEELPMSIDPSKI